MNFDFRQIVLTLIVFAPVTAAIIIFLTPKERTMAVRITALTATIISLVLAIAVFVLYDRSAAETIPAAQYQFQALVPWVPSLGISYHVGVDGIGLVMVLLTGIVSVMGVIISWNIKDRIREFMAFFMLLVAGVFGVFVSLDLFLLVFFYELSIFPMYIMIAIWGSTRKEYAAMKLTLYLLVGSIIALVGILAVYFSADSVAMGLQPGQHTFDLLLLQQGNIPIDVQRIWFLPIFIGFGVLAGIWPFHNWSPDGHVAAPTAVSMIHAGVLDEVGGVRRDHRHAVIAGCGARADAVCDSAGDGQRGVWRGHRDGAERLQVRHRLLVGQPHGAGDDGLCHDESGGHERRGAANVEPRHHDGLLLLRGRVDLRSGPHAPDQ